MRVARHHPKVVALFSLFLNLVGFGIIIPVQPFYAESFGATPLMITSLGAIFSLMQFLFAPFWGRLSDRVGRRPVMLISIVLGGVGHLLFALATSYSMLFAVRALAGFGMANLGTAQAIISDTTPPEERAKGMGMVGAAFGLGFIFGPAIGGILGQFDPRYPALFAAAVSGVNAVMAYAWLNETLPQGKSKKDSDLGMSSFALLQRARRHGVGTILLTTLIVGLSFSMMEQVIALFLEHAYLPELVRSSASRMAGATRLTAWFLVTVGVVAVVVQGGLIGSLRARFGERQLVRVGIALTALGMWILPAIAHARVFAWILGGAAILATGMGLFNPSSTALVSLSVPVDEQGVTLGLNQSSSALGRIGGPLLGGWLFARWPELPFEFSAVLMALAFLVSLRLPVGRERLKRSTSA
jgi:multidrug resistance protein